MGFPAAVAESTIEQRRADFAQRSSYFGARPDVNADPRVRNVPDMPPGVMAAQARSMALPEPFRFAANFPAAEVEQVLNASGTAEHVLSLIHI